MGVGQGLAPGLWACAGGRMQACGGGPRPFGTATPVASLPAAPRDAPSAGRTNPQNARAPRHCPEGRWPQTPGQRPCHPRGCSCCPLSALPVCWGTLCPRPDRVHFSGLCELSPRRHWSNPSPDLLLLLRNHYLLVLFCSSLCLH